MTRKDVEVFLDKFKKGLSMSFSEEEMKEIRKRREEIKRVRENVKRNARQ